MQRRPRASEAIGLAVVGQTRHGRSHHEQDRPDQRDVGRRRLADQVEGDGTEQQPDRDVGDGRVERVAQPAPLRQITERPDGTKERPRPPLVEIPEWFRPSVVDGDQASQEPSQRPTSHRNLRPAAWRGCCISVAAMAIHISSTSV